MFLLRLCATSALSLPLNHRVSTDLGYAARDGDMKTMRSIFEKSSARELNIESALCLSASYCRIPAMRYLIAMGAKDTNTALVAASVRNQMQSVRFLVSKEQCKVPATDLVSAIKVARNVGAADVEWFLLTTLKHTNKKTHL